MALPVRDAKMKTVQHVLRPEHVEQMRQLNFLLSFLEQQKQQVLNQQATILNIGYGVNINEGDWHLDLDSGVLSRGKPDNQ